MGVPAELGLPPTFAVTDLLTGERFDACMKLGFIVVETAIDESQARGIFCQ